MIFHDRRTGTLHEINDSTLIRHANATRQIINTGMGGGVETLQDPKGKVDYDSQLSFMHQVFKADADDVTAVDGHRPRYGDSYDPPDMLRV